ncbi:MAG: primosomal protein N', partial [Fibrobacter sp.]|nr:primosomal protein N' [Fibrobacter sp.]
MAVIYSVPECPQALKTRYKKHNMVSEISQHISATPIFSGPVVSVAFPIAIPGIYDYRIPGEFSGCIKPGTPVLVELKNRQTWGVAVLLKEKSEFPDLKEVLQVREGQWVDGNQTLIKLYKWIASYYQCDLGRVFRPLVRKGLISAKSKTVQVYSVCKKDTSELSDSYRDILHQLSACGEFLPADVIKKFGLKNSAVSYLYNKGYLEKREKTVLREADELSIETSSDIVKLTGEQQTAVESVFQTFDNPQKPFLLHGITGSGKTHVYIELAERAMRAGKGVIILVPEISLTPQTIQRFRSALGDVIAVIHSHMSDGERRDSLQEIVTGNKRVVIGVRSAILAPMQDIGLIIVDEEHDSSYKQSDTDPRYNARDVAVMRGNFQKAVVVLGSATPSLESCYNALNGKYHLLKLSGRFGAASLPDVEIVDMGAEHRENNWTPFSRLLVSAINDCLDRKRQIILLLNRRGFSTVLICKDCGHTYTCPNCSVNLRYHRQDNTLKCHLCNHEQPAPETCPKCRGEQIKYKGTGIQKIEEALKEEFPAARIIRMDQDTTRRKGAHVQILGKFGDGEADILLGTQMVSKGLDFKGVALVGVINADTGLNFPDFRASERTFQLLSQVSGRAGRSDSSGIVVIQTYFPQDAAILSARQHDYQQFYDTEIKFRQELGYPPFGKLTRIVVSGKEGDEVRKKIGDIAGQLRRLGGAELQVLGPSPAVLEKIANEVRYSILIKTRSPQKMNTVLAEVRR